MPTAPELYGLVMEGRTCTGDQRCHWCAASCDRSMFHDEPPAIIGVRRKFYPRIPASPYICEGCWVFRRSYVTINFVSGGFKDRQTPKAYSWLITSKKALAIQLPCRELYPHLLRPAKEFALSLTEKDRDNLLHMTRVNVNEKVLAETPLHYTFNGIPLSYTVYQLEHALRNGLENGVEPGVRQLIELLGPYPLPKEEKVIPTPQGGRPKPKDDALILKKAVPSLRDKSKSLKNVIDELDDDNPTIQG